MMCVWLELWRGRTESSTTHVLGVRTMLVPMSAASQHVYTAAVLLVIPMPVRADRQLRTGLDDRREHAREAHVARLGGGGLAVDAPDLVRDHRGAGEVEHERDEVEVLDVVRDDGHHHRRVGLQLRERPELPRRESW